jgi:hypothetical protein
VTIIPSTRHIIITANLLCSTLCKGQVSDSIVIYGKSSEKAMKVRRSDSLDFFKYSFVEGLKRYLVKDTLVIFRKRPECLPTMEYIGEYITADSVSVIDFVESNGQFIRLCFDGGCRNSLCRDVLPTICSLLICSNRSDFKFARCTMYNVTQGKILDFEIIEPTLSRELQYIISSLRSGESIPMTDVKVDTPYGRRKIDELSLSSIK